MKKLLKQSKYFKKQSYRLLSVFLFVVLFLSCQINVGNDPSRPTFSINTVNAGLTTSVTLTASTSVNKVTSYNGSKILVKRTHAGLEQDHEVSDVTVASTRSTTITITFTTSFSAVQGNTIIITIPAGYFEDNFGNENKLTTLTTVVP